MTYGFGFQLITSSCCGLLHGNLLVVRRVSPGGCEEKGYDRVVSIALLLTVACTAGAAAVSKVVCVRNSFGGGREGKMGKADRE